MSSRPTSFTNTRNTVWEPLRYNTRVVALLIYIVFADNLKKK